MIEFSLLGACSYLQDIVDTQYIVDMEKNSEDIGNGVVFYGFRKSKILLDKKLKRWTIISLDNDTKILELADEATDALRIAEALTTSPDRRARPVCI